MWLQRWSVSFGLEFGTFKPKEDDGKSLAYSAAEASVRYRLQRSVDLGAVLFAGGADESDVGFAGLMLEGRYLFRPGRAWNPFASFAIGVTSIAPNSGSDDQKKGRGALRFGGGIEHRWGWFALEASLHIIGVGANHPDPDATGGSLPLELARDSASGAQLSISGTGYF